MTLWFSSIYSSIDIYLHRSFWLTRAVVLSTQTHKQIYESSGGGGEAPGGRVVSASILAFTLLDRSPGSFPSSLDLTTKKLDILKFPFNLGLNSRKRGFGSVYISYPPEPDACDCDCQTPPTITLHISLDASTLNQT